MQEQPSFSSFPQPTGVPDYGQQPIQQPPAPVPEPPQKPGAPKGLIVTVILLAILLLGAIGFIVYMFYSQPKPVEEKKTDTTTSETTEASKTGDADKVIASIRTALTEKIVPTYKDTSFETGTTAPFYKAKDEAFAVGGTFGFSLSVDPAPTGYDEKANKAVQDVIVDTLSSKSRFTVTNNEWSSLYQDETVICNLITNGAPVNVSCANIADYKDSIAKAKPFATAYLNSADGKKYGEGITLGNITITQKTGGYSNAVVSMGSTLSPVGGYAGLFYGKDGNWTYFRGTQAFINCSDYNTYDIQASFEGDACYDTAATNKPAVVKVTLTK